MKNSRRLALALLLLTASPAVSRPDLCESAIPTAAREAGVPVDVLYAIAVTETGRTQNGQLRPWPWAANGGGEGHWFATRDEALAFAQRMLARGERSFDLGCFQINWRWHGEAFGSPAALLDPPTAARYAAEMLARLHAQLGSWTAAAGAYHSRSPDRARRYAARFARIRNTLADLPAPAPAEPLRTAPAFPLLTGTARGASLVPAALPSGRPLIESRP